MSDPGTMPANQRVLLVERADMRKSPGVGYLPTAYTDTQIDRPEALYGHWPPITIARSYPYPPIQLLPRILNVHPAGIRDRCRRLCVISHARVASSTGHTPARLIISGSETKLFIPSEFGLDDANPSVREMTQGIFNTEYAHILDLQKSEKEMDWIGIVNGAFFDMCMNDGEVDVLPKERRMVIYDQGDVKFSASTLSFVGQALVRTLEKYKRDRESVRNRFIYIAEMNVTQNELLELVQNRTGVKWEVECRTSDELLKEGVTALREGRIMDAIKPLCFVTGYKGLMDLIKMPVGLKEDVEGAMAVATTDW